MIRRRAALPTAAAVLAIAGLLGGCSPAPSVSEPPRLTDPSEILAKAAASIAGIRTVEIMGSFSGTLKSPAGTFDLSEMTLASAVDLPNRTAKVNLDAPSLLGTRLNAIVVRDTVWYTVAGALAVVLPGTADRFTKVPLASPNASGDPIAAALDPITIAREVQTLLARLPVPPTKAPDERCGDADCYHLTLALTGAQLQSLAPIATLDGTVSIDLWTRVSDNRPIKTLVSIVSGEFGTVGMTLELRYDGDVSIEAPPADRVLP